MNSCFMQLFGACRVKAGEDEWERQRREDKVVVTLNRASALLGLLSARCRGLNLKAPWLPSFY